MSENNQHVKAPDALMLLGTSCPHCPAVLNALAELVKQGLIASLEVVNLEQKPEVASKLGVRTVPWVRIGWYELEGLRGKPELQKWAEKAGSGEGAAAYFSEVLAEGKVNKVIDILSRQHELMDDVIALLTDADEKINVRLGIGVIMEEFAAANWFAEYIPGLGDLTQHEDERVRSDVCHYLSLTGSTEAVPYIKNLLNDSSADVREVAKESMEVLRKL